MQIEGRKGSRTTEPTVTMTMSTEEARLLRQVLIGAADAHEDIFADDLAHDLEVALRSATVTVPTSP